MLRKIVNVLKNSDSIEEMQTVREELLELFPLMRRALNFDQKHYSHQYFLWEHSLHTVLNLPRNLDDDMLYLGAFLHDIAKPDAQCRGKDPDDPNMHYYHHPEMSEVLVREQVLPELERRDIRLSDEEKTRLLFYVRHHDDNMLSDNSRCASVRKLIEEAGEDTVRKLMLLEVADAYAHNLIDIVRERIRVCEMLTGDYFGTFAKACMSDA